jgi:hypothetical protein
VTPLSLNVTASVRHVTTGRVGIQTVFVYVTDQYAQPVTGADVTMIVRHDSSGTLREFLPTDSTGFTKASFDILPSPPGQRIVIDIRAAHSGLVSTTQAFFLSWQ